MYMNSRRKFPLLLLAAVALLGLGATQAVVAQTTYTITPEILLDAAPDPSVGELAFFNVKDNNGTKEKDDKSPITTLTGIAENTEIWVEATAKESTRHQLESITVVPEGGTETKVDIAGGIFTLSSNATVRAVFKAIQQTVSTYTVSSETFLGTTSDAAVGTIVIKNGADPVDLSKPVDKDTELTVEAIPTDPDKHELEKLEIIVGDDAATAVTTDITTSKKFTVTGTTKVKATFKEKSTSVTPTPTPTGDIPVTIHETSNGKLKVTADDGTEIKNGDKVSADTKLTITATPDEGYQLKWIRVNDLAHKNGEAYTVTAVKAVSIKAEFEPLYQVTPDESLALARVQVGPNPFMHFVEVKNAEGVIRYELLDLTGVIVRNGQHHGEAKLMLNTNALPNGIYLLKLYADDGERAMRLLKY